jgi:hypothetical protein
MFEFINTFWGGAVSVASGLLVLYSASQLLSQKPKRLIFDFRSSNIPKPKVPSDFEIAFHLGSKSFSNIYLTELILKNETGAPLTDESFLHLPKVLLGKENVLCRTAKVESIDDSRASVRFVEKDLALELFDLMIPIDSSATIEIVTEQPIDQKITSVHRFAKFEHRDYGTVRRSLAFYYFLPFSLFLLSLALGYAITTWNFPNPYKPLYDFNKEWISAEWAGLLILPQLLIASLLGVFAYRWTLGASNAERRFAELKM